jgi:hypothetical protein
MESFVEGVGMFFIAIGGIAAILAALCFLWWLVETAWIAASNRFRDICKAESLMAKMVEDAQEKTAALEAEIAMNGEAITRENVIANLKADADILRMKLKDTETALGRSANEASRLVSELQDVKLRLLDAEYEADLAHECPWRNLWAWVKRKLKMA